MNCTRWNVPPSTAAVVLIVSVFASPGTPSISRWPAGEQADEHALEHLLLARDHAPDLEQRLLELAPTSSTPASLARWLPPSMHPT